MLPEVSKQPWPPVKWKPFADDITVADSWYSGDPTNIAVTRRPSRNPIARAFNKTTTQPEPKTETKIRVPAAADVAQLGADLLFGDTPTFLIPEAHTDHVDLVAETTEARLLDIVQADGWASTLLEGAEIAGALGGIFLRPVVDLDLSDHPILTVVHPDAAVPEFRHGHLVAVTFWAQWAGDKGKVWRHLERHEKGSIEHALYLGSVDELGVRQHLSLSEETISLVTDETDRYGGGFTNLQEQGVDRMLPGYVPNALPNRRHRTRPVGRSDTANCEDLLAALDETWSSWMRDIRLAKARLIIPDEFLERNGRGQGATFDYDRELFSPLQIDPTHMDSAGITLVQFEIRNAEHEATIKALFTQIVETAGYSPQSFGLPGNGSAQTATEVDARTDRSTATTQRKQGYWRRAVEDVAESVLWLDKVLCENPTVPYRPTIVFPATNETDMRDTASMLNLIGLAKAASTETKVRYLHPDWTDAQVTAEAQAILAEDGTAVPDPTGGL